MSRLTDKIAEIAEPVVREAGCSLWDVEFVKEAGTRYLRVFIDKDEGVSIDDCERISRQLDPILDEADLLADSYVFEVGSAGADRELRRPSDFLRFMGSEVEVHLYRPLNGSKLFVGVLEAYDDGALTISQTGKPLHFEKDQIAQVRLYVSFD